VREVLRIFAWWGMKVDGDGRGFGNGIRHQ
jgi:hypothetical protein